MSVLKEIASWSKSCPGWQRDALRRLVLNGTLSTDDIEELILLCQSPHGSLPDGESPPSEEALSEKHLPQDPAKNQSVTLASIKDVKNVNAIESKQPLAFADADLTVLYGDNAAGKSGYTRILKSACRARSRPKRILSNVFRTTGNDPASATIEFKVGTKANSHSWRAGETALSPLALVSVFDSACALHYVEEANDVAFRPFGLDLLDKLASTCVQLKRRFDEERARLLTATKDFTDLSGPTDVGKVIQSLSAHSDPAVVEKLASLSAEETRRLEELKRHIAQIEADDPIFRAKELKGRAGRLDILAKRFLEIETALSDAKVGEIKEAFSLSNTKSAAAKLASETAFQDEPLKNVGSETWKQLWEAARQFSEKDAYPDISFPVTSHGAVCVLCEQPLSTDAVRRFSRFEEFVKAETQKAAQTAKERFDFLHEDFLEHTNDLTAPEDLLTQLELTHSICATKIRSFLESCGNRRSDIVRAILTNDWANIQGLKESPAQDIEKVAAELKTKSSEFERAKAPEKLAELRAERDQLLARSTLNKRKSDVRSEISRLKRLNVLAACLRDVDTTSISRKSTELTTSRVTKTICDSFRTELDGLGLSHLRVELTPIGSERGVMYHRVGLKGNKTVSVQDVASEGEHRCIALAAFLAELATASHKSALVFDDPVSSLDHRWRESVARRLVIEAKQRQVIVFTHDLVFLILLLEQAEKEAVNITQAHITLGRESTGVTNPGPPWLAMDVKNRIGVLKVQWAEAEKLYRTQGPIIYEAVARDLYGRLRETWERAVEELLLNKSVLRFRRSIETQRLKKITDITDVDIQAIESAMTKCSTHLRGHDQAPAINQPVPAPAELETDIKQLEDWVAQMRKRGR